MDNVPYIPLYLSDDTHVLRKEWVNFTTPAGGPFTAFNPRSIVFMYDDGTGILPAAPDYTLYIIIGAGAIVGIIVIFMILKRR